MIKKNSTPTPPRKIVVVVWQDIQTRADWVGGKKEVIEEVKPIECVTVGWVIYDSKEYILLADTVSKDKDYGGVTVIPKGVVGSIEELSKRTPTSFMQQ